jgi:hypothetical protein
MKRSLFALSVALMLFAAPVIAGQGGPKPKSPSPKSHVTSKPTAPPQASTMKTKPVSAKPTVSKGNASKPLKTTTTTKPVKTTTTSTAKASKPSKTETKLARTETKATKADKKTAKTDTKTSTAMSASTSTSTSTGATDPESVTLTPVQQKLQRNTKLADKLETRLPKGTDLMLAAEGFKNLGQFVAAVNVSNNLGLDFAKLKADMLSGMSLGQAIQEQRKVSSATVEAQRAEYDARVLIAETEQQVSTTSSTSTPTTTTSSSTTTTSTGKPKQKKAKKNLTTQPSTTQQ